MHFGQLIEAAQFQKYDFGSDSKNKSAYGTARPPLIPFSAVTGPKVAFFVGGHDTIGDPTDAKLAYAALPKGAGVYY
jgi:hypothetical protein